MAWCTCTRQKIKMGEKITFDKVGNGAFSTKLFWIFFVISLLTLVYFNSISAQELKLVSAQFPDFDETKKRAIVSSYRISISVALFFIDVILVGPFAYLSYFGDHIKPSRKNRLVQNISIFDLGIALALVFTLALASAHILIIDCVSPIRLSAGEFNTILWFNAATFAIWVVVAFMKFYTYSPEQRKELSKYAIYS